MHKLPELSFNGIKSVVLSNVYRFLPLNLFKDNTIDDSPYKRSSYIALKQMVIYFKRFEFNKLESSDPPHYPLVSPPINDLFGIPLTDPIIKKLLDLLNPSIIVEFKTFKLNSLLEYSSYGIEIFTYLYFKYYHDYILTSPSSFSSTSTSSDSLTYSELQSKLYNSRNSIISHIYDGYNSGFRLDYTEILNDIMKCIMSYCILELY